MNRINKTLIFGLIIIPILFGSQQYAFADTDDLQETYKNLEIFLKCTQYCPTELC